MLHLHPVYLGKQTTPFYLRDEASDFKYAHSQLQVLQKNSWEVTEDELVERVLKAVCEADATISVAELTAVDRASWAAV